MKLLAVTHPTQDTTIANSEKINIYSHNVPFSLLNIEVNLDAVLEKDMVLVRKTAFSLNYRDKGICLKAFKQLVEDDELNKYFAIGSEFAGIVVKTGTDIVDLKIGDRVIPNHSYPTSGYPHVLAGVISNKCSTEYAIFHFSKLVKMPDAMSDEVGAAFSLGAQTAYSMIRKSAINVNEIALITSASSNTSLHLINALVIKGMEVHIITTQKENIVKFKKMGVSKAYWYNKDLDFFDSSQDIVKEKVVFDVVFDPMFDIYFTKVLELLKNGGRYLTCGRYDQFSPMDDDYDSSKEPTINLPQLMGFLLHNNISLIGNCLGTRDDLLNAIFDFEHKGLQVVVDSLYSSMEFAKFIERSFNSKERLGKVICMYQ